MHIPVLKKEVIQSLGPKANENFIDCTIGFGGHGLALLEIIKPNGRVLGIDWDGESLYRLESKIEKLKIKERLILVNDNFANLQEIVKRKKFNSVNGLFLDLGYSSWHLEKSGRGFGFLKDEPLDMRYNENSELTAEKIINYYSLEELVKFLKEYGEERFSYKIAQEIIKQRNVKPITRTSQLVEVVKRATPIYYQRKKIHCATKTFQAIRVAVNDELNNLNKVLSSALKVLEEGGRIVVISFHSLEDRIVKRFFKEEAKKNNLIIINKKPVVPSKEEIKNNHRSRSAKLRTAIKICPKQTN